MGHIRTRSLVAVSAFALVASITTSPVHAQQAPATQEAMADEGEEPLVGNEIVVTARRRAETLQDVPIAISAFDQSALESLQADDLSGIQYAVPNLYLDQGDAGNAVIYIRGVGQNDSLAFADPGVGVYIDDVFIARSQAAFLDVFDVERIEVLRGPQGTLYGRNTIGGAIKFVSARPTDYLTGAVELGVGNYGEIGLKARVSGPIVGDTLTGKAAFAFKKRDGYNFNTFTQTDDGDVETYAGRIGLRFAPSPDLEFLLTGDVKVDRPDTSRSPVRATAVTGADATGALVNFPAASDPYRVQTNANGLNDQTSYGGALTARWFASDSLTLESITAYRGFEFDLKLDTDGSPLPLLDILLRQDQSQFSQEVRATYEADGLSVTGGLYYFHDDDLTFSGVDNGSAVLFGLPVTAFGFASSSLADTQQITDSYAIFADGTYALSERLELSLGARYTWENRTSARRFENYFDPAISVIDNEPDFLAGSGVVGTPISGEADFEAFTPRASLSFEASPDMLFYGSVSRGFKSGGFDGRANTDFGFRPFRPEFVWAYELGAKTSWLDRRLTLNGALFYNDYSDLQVTSFGADPVTGVFVSQFTNAASSRSFGAELELSARPTDRLTLTGSIGLLDAKYREFDILVGGVATDASDRSPVNSPDFNGSLGATYKLPIGGRFALTMHGDASYRSEVATEITDSPDLRQDGYEMIIPSLPLAILMSGGNCAQG